MNRKIFCWEIITKKTGLFTLTAYLLAYYNIGTENCTFYFGGEFYVSS